MKVNNVNLNTHQNQQSFGNIKVLGQEVCEQSVKELVKKMSPSTDAEKLLSAIKNIEAIDKLSEGRPFIINIYGEKDYLHLYSGELTPTNVDGAILVDLNPVEQLNRKLSDAYSFLRAKTVKKASGFLIDTII